MGAWTTAMIDLLERGQATVAWNLAAHVQTVPLTRKRPTHILLASEIGVSVKALGVTISPEAVVILGVDGC